MYYSPSSEIVAVLIHRVDDLNRMPSSFDAYGYSSFGITKT